MNPANVFQPLGQQFTFSTNGTPSTNQTRTLLVTNILPNATGNPVVNYARLAATAGNTGTILVLFAQVSTAAVLPTAGTTTVGTPKPGFLLHPGEILYCTLPPMAGNPGGVDPPVAGWFMSDISSVATQTYDLLFGQ
jgi:hypothetical protein